MSVLVPEKVPEVEIPEFHGDSYLILPVPENISEQTNIEIWLLTRNENGTPSQFVSDLLNFNS